MTPAKLVKSLPTQVKVGYNIYTIENWPTVLATAADRYGECDRMNQIIRLRTDLPIRRLANTLIHEIMHACWENAAADGGGEEQVVTVMSNQLSSVFTDSPDIVRWLSKALV